MISKERLEELIEQCATIWGVYDYTYSYDKPNKKVEHINLDMFYHYYKDIDEFIMYQGDYCNLFETEEEAEWYRDFGCIEKIERLWFPTWESVYNDLKDYKDGDFYILDNDHFSFVYNKRYETSQLFLYTHNEKYNWNANKENYYEACKLAKSLFLGEKR